jgi:hypothetical protein
MSTLAHPIIHDMVSFMDSLVMGISPKNGKKLKEARRKEFIFEFFERAGFIRLTERKKFDYVWWDITEKGSEAIRRGRPRNKQDYVETALHFGEYERVHGMKLEEFDFLACVGTMFAHEEKSFFRWVRSEMYVIQFGRVVLTKLGSSKRSTDDAIKFAVSSLFLVDRARCLRHFLSRWKRDERRRRAKREARRQRELEAERQRVLVVENIPVGTSLVTEESATDLATHCAETSPMPSTANI